MIKFFFLIGIFIGSLVSLKNTPVHPEKHKKEKNTTTKNINIQKSRGKLNGDTHKNFKTSATIK